MENFKVSMAETDVRRPLTIAQLDVLNATIAKSVQIVSDNNFKKFVGFVGKRGQIFCSATFKGKMKSKDTFEQAQLFVLYFDNTKRTNTRISFYDVMDRAKGYGLPVLFAYDFYSSEYFDTVEKYCLAFLLNAPILELRAAMAIQEALMKIFPEADKSSDVLRIYQGGNRVLHWDKSMTSMNAEWLFMKMCLYLKDQYGLSNYKRKIIEFAKKQASL